VDSEINIASVFYGTLKNIHDKYLNLARSKSIVYIVVGCYVWMSNSNLPKSKISNDTRPKDEILI
jgi:hypothetical protein